MFPPQAIARGGKFYSGKLSKLAAILYSIRALYYMAKKDLFYFKYLQNRRKTAANMGIFSVTKIGTTIFAIISLAD